MPYVASTLGTYSTGTVTVVNGSTAVTGSGTVWGDIVNEGDLFTIDDDKFYYVAALNSDTSLTLDKPYAESSASGINYRVMLNTAAHFPSDVAAKVERALSGMGDVYCPIDHASSGSDYGLASASLYGHAKASGTTPKAPGTASVGTETNKFARGDHVHPHDDTKLDKTGGAFNKVFFSRTSGDFTAPYTGVYRVTLKGGGGGGSYPSAANYTTGAGGGSGGTLIFYITLTKNTVYPYTIGAGGTVGTVDSPNGSNGGASTFNSQWSIGGGGGAQSYNNGGFGGYGGTSRTVPTGATNYIVINGKQGDAIKHGAGEWVSKYSHGGEQDKVYDIGTQREGLGMGGQGGGGVGTSTTITTQSYPGTDGYIMIEYGG